MRASCGSLILLASLTGGVSAWSTPSGAQQRTSTTSQVSRQDFFKSVVGTTAAAGAAFVLQKQPAFAEEGYTPEEIKTDPAGTVVNLPSGVKYTVIKAGDGPKPQIGELTAIRFSAYYGDNKIDDIFDTPEPYYTRMGSGGLLKGVETTLPLMRVGDRWKLEIPGELAFGKKGRPASAGKPRIPANAEILFEVEVVGLPGKEQELIELIGDY